MTLELKTSQIAEYRKLLKTVLDGLDSAYKIRQGLIEYDSATKLEYARYDSLNDPEPYYHIKLFDKAIGIVRLYNVRDWSIDDPEKKYFHFTIRIYNFRPSSYFNLSVKSCYSHSDYGEFLDISDCMKYFYNFTCDLIASTFKLDQNLFKEVEIF